MSNRRWFRVDVLILLIAIVARVIPGPRTVDDAYITFRYSQNLLNGDGLVYNPGESVLGTTTPLYALVLSLLAAFFGSSQAPYPILALGINTLFDALTCWILIDLSRRSGYPRAGFAVGLLWALSPMSVTFAIGGMETSFFILILMGSLYMYSRHRPVAAALLAACSLITRPDALLAVLPMLAARLFTYAQREGNHPSLIEILAFSLPLGLWGIVGTLSYGSPIPQSVTAKTLAYQLPNDAALVRLLQHFATPFQGNLLLGRTYIAFGLLCFPALAILGWRQVLRERATLWPLAIYPLVYFLAYSIANPLIFRWYLVPPLPLYFLGLLIGLECLAREMRRPWILWIGTLIFLLFTLNAWTLQPDHGPRSPAPRMAYIRLEQLYIETIQELQPYINPTDTIAAGDIGALGYYGGTRILDMVGLISPATLPYFPLPPDAYVINYAVPTALVLDLKPDWIIILEVYGRRTLLLDPAFQRAYALVRELPTDIYGSEALLVFERR